MLAFKKIPLLLRTRPKERWKNISLKDIADVALYLRKNELSLIDGGCLSEFEKRFAKYIGCKYAVAFCNGTAALHAASYACNDTSKTEVLSSIYSYHGTVLSLLENNYVVKLVSYDPNTLCIDTKSIEKNISTDTWGVVVTHCWGNLANYHHLKKIKEEYNLKIIIDASHAHGAEFDGLRVGNIDVEDVVCFSLGRNKLMSAGELGVAVTNDRNIYERLLFFGHPNRTPGVLPLESRLRMYANGIGNKYRPHALALVLGINQIRKFEKKKRANIATNNYLSDEIKKIPGFILLDQYEGGCRVYWKLCLKIDTDYFLDTSVEQVCEALLSEGLVLENYHNYNISENIEVWKHPRYASQLRVCSTQRENKAMVFLPGYIDLSKGDMHKIIKAFRKVSYDKARLK